MFLVIPTDQTNIYFIIDKDSSLESFEIARNALGESFLIKSVDVDMVDGRFAYLDEKCQFGFYDVLKYRLLSDSDFLHVDRSGSAYIYNQSYKTRNFNFGAVVKMLEN